MLDAASAGAAPISVSPKHIVSLVTNNTHIHNWWRMKNTIIESGLS